MTGIKSIVFFGTNQTATSNNNQTNATLVAPPALANLAANGSYNKAHVLLNFPTVVSEGNGTMSISVQELFSGVGYVETANSTVRTIRSGQRIWLVNDPGTLGNLNGNTDVMVGSFPLLGTGREKRIVFTESSIQTIYADAYFVFMGGQ